MLNFIVSGQGTIHLSSEGSMFPPVRPDHLNYNAILDLLRSGDADVAQLALLTDLGATINEMSNGDLVATDGTIKYKDVVLDRTPMHQRLFDLMSEGQNFQPLFNFIDNLMKNPSKASVDQLYDFLDQQGLPITEDGCFLAYKAVTTEFCDKWTGKIDNKIGEHVEVERNTVTDDPSQACASGLHCGSLKYVKWYGGSGDQIILVKVNPKDAVSVPNAEKTNKLRVCAYDVVEKYGTYGEVYGDNEKSVLDGALYTAGGQRVEPTIMKDNYVGEFDNEEGDHWDDQPETYFNEMCTDCDELIDECTCSDYNDDWDLGNDDMNDYETYGN